MITTATQAFSSRDWALLAAATQDGQQFSACANVMAFYAIHPSAPSATVLGERRAAGDAFIAELDEGDRIYVRPAQQPAYQVNLMTRTA